MRHQQTTPVRSVPTFSCQTQRSNYLLRSVLVRRAQETAPHWTRIHRQVSVSNDAVDEFKCVVKHVHLWKNGRAARGRNIS